MATPIPKSEVLVPLYIYPNPGAWDPLFEAIASNPALRFVVIVNPNSGPGSEPWWPNADYVRNIPKLNAYPNVRTVGYVSTAYCNRLIEEVFEDVKRYANWFEDEKNQGLGLNGIFFDETPNTFREEARDYLEAITQNVKKMGRLLGDNIVIHNPGTSIDGRLATPGMDIATVAEVAYHDFQTMEFQNWLAESSLHRNNTSYMIHGVSEEVVEDFVVQTLRRRAKYIFVTDRKTDMYHNFGASWKAFISAMASSEAT
ncbi:hypothetical protein P171DRAFT_8929 [Karstenula rhodostoma CBS 690.94]|uniref:Cell surface spherulin 4-like protein n=1 Tax=Karstenula rhodostoma CBS 690.94 TaxID=1392251 RepID=A0A9P4UIW8_9PLEO|nr:hypothetical protein P171DRAFT_8929 [Karstenula rhodostoma CBS 690.94]